MKVYKPKNCETNRILKDRGMKETQSLVLYACFIYEYRTFSRSTTAANYIHAPPSQYRNLREG